MRQQSITYKISYLQKMANQFLILISSTECRLHVTLVLGVTAVDVVIITHAASVWPADIPLLQCRQDCLADGELFCCKRSHCCRKLFIWHHGHLADMGM